MCTVRVSRWCHRFFGPCQPQGRLGFSFQLLVWAWHSPGCYGHCGARGRDTRRPDDWRSHSVDFSTQISRREEEIRRDIIKCEIWKPNGKEKSKHLGSSPVTLKGQDQSKPPWFCGWSLSNLLEISPSVTLIAWLFLTVCALTILLWITKSGDKSNLYSLQP